jgi:hypothetical protein
VCPFGVCIVSWIVRWRHYAGGLCGQKINS